MKCKYSVKVLLLVMLVMFIALPVGFAATSSFVDECSNLEISEIVETSGNLQALDTDQNAGVMGGDKTRYRREGNQTTDNGYIVYKMENPIESVKVTTYHNYKQAPEYKGEIKLSVSNDGKAFTPVNAVDNVAEPSGNWGIITYSASNVPAGNTYLKIDIIDIDGDTGNAMTPQIGIVEITMGEAAKAEEPKVEKKEEAPKAEAPKVEKKEEAPKAEAPKVEKKEEAPKAEAPKAEAPKAEKKAEATPKATAAKEDKKNPKTGDYASVMYFTALLAAGVAGIKLSTKKK